jgi:hypothetical protein
VISATAAVAGLGISSAALASSGSPAAASVRACTAEDLGVWLAADQGDGAAGTIYYPLQFTNLSGHACSLHGFAGISAIDRSGHQLGSPARWDHGRTPRTVVLAAGATAHAVLGWSDVAIATAPGCRPTFSATELRIYPPNQRSATHAAFSLEVCSRPGPIFMSVGPIIPGAGTRNG